MDKVAVLLSSYNGEKYLKEQLDSITEQPFDGIITIYIRDDGSNDSTKELIQNYPQTPMRRVIFAKGRNVGPQRSFLRLIRMAPEADYYFFADQDDIWYKNKISTAVRAMAKSAGPICFCSNYDICGDNIHKLKKKFIRKEPLFRPLKIVFYNQIPGCTMGFNRPLMKLLKKIRIDNVMMHDSMVLSLAAAVGSICYEPSSLIAHRIHSDNVVGAGHKKIILHKWIVDKIRLVIKKDDYDISKMAEEFLKTGNVKDEYRDDLILLRDYKRSLRNTVKLLRHRESHDKFMDRTTLSIRSKIMFHVF